MADEIVVLEGDGANRFDLLFLFPIAAPEQVLGSNVSPSNSDFLQGSADLPTAAQAILTTAEKASIDSGDSAWELFPNFLKQPGLTNAQLVAMVQEFYGLGLSAFGTKYASVFLHIGQRVNAA